jgi:AcrR family transcriptional regulator
MTDGQRRSRGRPRDPNVDDAILTAALELFIQKGADAVSIEQIAQRAGVAKMSLYRRWRSKEELLAQAIEHARLAMPDIALWHDNDTPLPQLLDRMLDAAAQTLTDPLAAALYRRLIGAGADYPSLLATYWQHFMQPRRALIHSALERAAREGLLRSDSDPATVMDLVAGAIVYRLLIHPGQLTPAEMRAYLSAVVRQSGVTLPADGPRIP